MTTTLDQRRLMDTLDVRKPEFAVKVSIAIESTEATHNAVPDVWVLYATSAPKAYDYYVIPVHESDGVRWVLVRERDVEFQLSKYSSGIYYTVLSEVPMAGSIEGMLWARLLRVEGA